MILPSLPNDAGADMVERDPVMRALGLRLLQSTAGRASVQLEIGVQHLNAAGVVHGGVLFTLADSAFAVAANNDGHRRLAAHGAIEFLRPAHVGDTLVARASLASDVIYDIVVENQRGEVVALMRGRASRPRP